LTVVFTSSTSSRLQTSTTLNTTPTFEVVNLLGQIILRGGLQNHKLNQNVDISALPSGTYILRLSPLPTSSDGGKLEQVKFVKQ
jgi:Secretion system C-terminal sorting domain